MKLKRVLLVGFDKIGTDDITVDLVSGARIIKVIALHDGIYGMFEVPELTMNVTDRYKFRIIPPNETIPDHSKCIDVLTLIVEVPATEDRPASQAVQIIPIYQILK